MNIDVFNEATELFNKYKLCQDVMAWLSNEEAVKGQKYKEALAKFVETFKGDFMMFVHERMTASGEAFENLHDCDCNKQPEEKPEEPTKEPKFAIGSKVEIVGGQFDGCVGIVKDFNEKEGTYYVMSGFVGSGNQFSMWFNENMLSEYIEESEEPEKPLMPFPEDCIFTYGDRVVVNGEIGTIIGYDFSEHKYGVLLDLDDEEPKWYAGDELEHYTEENGGTAETDKGE